MNADLYSEFRSSANSGDRKRAALFVGEFIKSFNDDSEKRAWARDFLESGEFGPKIRHEIYRDLIFPELERGYRSGEPWSLYFLAHTIQNIYDVRALHEQLDWVSDYSLLVNCYEVDPDFRDVRKQLLECVCRSLNFATHEWPSGLCCEIQDIESDLTLGRHLDLERRFSLMFGEVETILAESEARAKKI
ncbi:hypothetical protein N9891_01325 [bacterium]|nr:hypothetical protein [bacterium]